MPLTAETPEGSLFRMSFRHYLTALGYTRTQAQTIASGFDWEIMRKIVRVHGPNLLNIFPVLMSDVASTYGEPELPPTTSDFSEWNVDFTGWADLAKKYPDPDPQE